MNILRRCRNYLFVMVSDRSWLYDSTSLGEVKNESR